MTTPQQTTPPMTDEQATVAHLFRAGLLGGKNSDGRYFDWAACRPRPVELARDSAAWSTGERMLAALALDLWGYAPPDDRYPTVERFDANDWGTRLSGTYLLAALEAVAIRAGKMTGSAQRLAVVPREAEPV